MRIILILIFVLNTMICISNNFNTIRDSVNAQKKNSLFFYLCSESNGLRNNFSKLDSSYVSNKITISPHLLYNRLISKKLYLNILFGLSRKGLNVYNTPYSVSTKYNTKTYYASGYYIAQYIEIGVGCNVRVIDKSKIKLDITSTVGYLKRLSLYKSNSNINSFSRFSSESVNGLFLRYFFYNNWSFDLNPNFKFSFPVRDYYFKINNKVFLRNYSLGIGIGLSHTF
jgi:hypothetical protein